MNGVAHLWRLMAVVWFALALQWEAESAHGHAALTFLAGLVCYMGAERIRERA